MKKRAKKKSYIKYLEKKVDEMHDLLKCTECKGKGFYAGQSLGVCECDLCGGDGHRLHDMEGHALYDLVGD